MGKKYRIAQVGSFDVENYGDLLFADVFDISIKRNVEVDEIVLFAPKKCIMPFSDGKREVFAVTELDRVHQEKPFDVIVVGGGDLVQCVKIRTLMPHLSSEWMDYEALHMWMIPSMVAWKYNVPLLWNALGVPHKFIDAEKMIVKELCRFVDYISVRDELSKSILEECGVTGNIQVVPDTVFSISQIISKEETEERLVHTLNVEKNKYIVFQANHTYIQTEMQGCVDALLKIKKEYQYEIVLLPIGYALGDELFFGELVKQCPGEFVTITKRMSPMDMITVISNAAGYIGASLHGCITASSYGVPIVACNYNRHVKMDGFLELLGVKEAVIYQTKNIYSVFEKRIVVSEENRQQAFARIRGHFQQLGQLFEISVKKEAFEAGLCEYVLSMKKMEQHYQEQYRQLQEKCSQEIAQLQHSEAQWIGKYQEAIVAYQGILDSTVWKMTKPIRALLNVIKRKR